MGRYQGFWIRAAATIIDSILFTTLSYLISVAFEFTSLGVWLLILFQWVLIMVVSFLYETILTWKFGGTVGKLLLRMHVVDEKGKPITYGASVIRYFSKFVSSLILMIGYMMAGWDARKQALHDKFAKTLVMDNPSTRISRRTSIVAIVLALLIAAGFIIFWISLIMMAAVAGFRSAMNPLSADAIAEVRERCADNDVCIYSYVANDPAMEYTKPEERVQLCKEIGLSMYRINCMTEVANSANNISICDELTGLQARRCKNAYEATSEIEATFIPRERYADGLLVEEVVLEEEVFGVCEKAEDNVFELGESPCFTFKGARDFVKGADNLHWYDFDMTVWSDQGLLRFNEGILEDEGRMYLFNNTLTNDGIVVRLADIPPGNYTYELRLYDKIGKREIRRNWTINVILPRPRPKLELYMDEMVVGKVIDDDCVPRVAVFEEGEVFCYKPINVRTFEMGDDELYWFDIDAKLRNSSNNLVNYDREIYDEDGRVVLEDGVLNGEEGEQFWVNYDTVGDAPGMYTQEVRIYDRISGRSVMQNFTFEIMR
jgi:uncharacterized RDD family membrane protein YckC